MRWKVLVLGLCLCVPLRVNSEPDGQVLLKEVQRCVAAKVATSRDPTLLSQECLYSVTTFNADGTRRADAQQRMMAVVKASGVTLPQRLSEGQTLVNLETVADSRVYRVPVSLVNTSRSFLLDTGASNSIITSTLAQELNLIKIPVPQKVFEQGVVGSQCAKEKIEVNIHPLPPVVVGSTKVKNIMGMGLPAARIPGGLQGVLGLDYLSSFDMVLDPTLGILQLSPPSFSPAQAIPLVGKMGALTVQTMINGQGPFTMVLDTGADLALVSERLAKRLGLKPQGTAKKTLMGFCGQEEGIPVQLNSVSIKNFGANNLEGVIFRNSLFDLIGADGLLGQNFLSRYRQHWRFGQVNELGLVTGGSLELTVP